MTSNSLQFHCWKLELYSITLLLIIRCICFIFGVTKIRLPGSAVFRGLTSKTISRGILMENFWWFGEVYIYVYWLLFSFLSPTCLWILSGTLCVPLRILGKSKGIVVLNQKMSLKFQNYCFNASNVWSK